MSFALRRQASAQAPRILVVDDNDENRFTLTLRLEVEGYTEVTCVASGEEALELISRQPFDLVLLDVMMPGLDGYGVLQRLKADPSLQHVPTIMISALGEIRSVVRCIELGAVDYLPKPFDPVLLKARIAATLEKKRLHDAELAQMRRVERELAAARDLQISMVPTRFPPWAPDWPVEIHALMEPAREVGGDLYDFFRLDDGRLCFLLGDVSDKGVPAALFMARTKNLVRLVAELQPAAAGGHLDPAAVISRVNRELCADNALTMFVTLFLGVLDPGTGLLRFANAGHCDPYRLSARSGAVAALSSPRGPPLGLRPGAIYGTHATALEPGDGLLVYSDGVTEAHDADGRLLGEAGLEAVLGALPSEPPARIVEGVRHAVHAFSAGTEQADDITMLALRWAPEAGAAR